MTRRHRYEWVLATLAALWGCGESKGQPRRVRIVSVHGYYQTGPSCRVTGGHWHTTIEDLETGTRCEVMGKLGEVGDEFNR